MKSFVTTTLLLLAGLFGTQHLTGPSTSRTAAVADSLPSPVLALALTTPPPTSTSATLPATSTGSSLTVLSQTASVDSHYVTRNELASQLAVLRSLVYQLAGTTTTAFTNPQIAANGNGVAYGAVAAPINQLSNITIANPVFSGAVTGLTASEIPDLSGTYLPLAGGTLTGALINSSSATSTFTGGFGIGTTSPYATLSIAGAADGAQDLFAISTSSSTNGTSTALRVSKNGNLHFLNGAGIDIGNGVTPPSNGLIVSGQVGIGTSTPSSGSSLDIVQQDAGTILRVATENPTASRFPSFFIDNYKNTFSGTGQILFRNWAGSISSPTSMLSGAGLGQIVFTGYAGSSNQLTTDSTVSISASTDENFSSTNAGAHLSFATTPLGGSSLGISKTEWMRITANGAVGFNTTAPAFQVDVKGFGRMSTTTFTGTGLNDASTTGNYLGTDISPVTYTIIIQTSGTPDQFEWQKNGGSLTTGVNITGGSQSLTDGVQIKFSATTGHTVGDQWVITVTPSNPFGVQNAAGTRAFSVENNGEVGIGTTSPNSLLEVSAVNANTTLTTFGDPTIAVGNRSGTVNTFATLAFKSQDAVGAASSTALISGIKTSNTSGKISGNLAFLTMNAGQIAEAARFNSSGQLGIGTTSPYAQLSVFAGSDFASHAASTLFAIASSSAGTATTTFLVVSSSGAVGIASTSPWRTFDVSGTVSFKGLSSVSTNQSAYLCLSSNNEVVQDSTTCLASSARFKQNIQPLSASSSLDEILALTPVSFQYTPEYNGALESDPNFNGTFVGFIAEDVAKIDPRLITVDATGTTPTAPHGVRYENITAILAGAIQEMADISGTFERNLVAWLGDASNGISQFFADTITANKQLCVRKSDGSPVCVTGDQLAAIMAQGGQQPSNVSTTADDQNSTSMPPVIQINGNNPATINVGDTYNDLGATITGPTTDLNLGIHTFVGSTPIDQAVIDTSAPATYHIYYVVTDQTGLTSTSTRTLIVQSLQTQTASSSNQTATTTEATSTNP